MYVCVLKINIQRDEVCNLGRKKGAMYVAMENHNIAETKKKKKVSGAVRKIKSMGINWEQGTIN